MTSPAPDTGRTAEDLLDDLDRANTVTEPQRCADLMDEARLVIIAARKERDEAQDLADKRLDLMWMDPDAARGRAMIAEANLIALAKMYGEACGALAEYRFAAVEWQGEQAEYKAAVEAEAAHLRTENANLRDRVREAEGAAEAMREACLKAAISASYGPPSSWPGPYPKGWKHPPCWEPGQKPTPNQAAWHDNGARDAWFAIRALAAPPVGLSEKGGSGAA